MKTKLILFVTMLSCGLLQSQEINCASTLDEFSKLVENQKFDDAETKMKQLLAKCPTSNENLYLLGAKVIQNKIDLSSNDDKEKAAKEMIALYDKYDQNFPNNKSNNAINKAMLYYDYNVASEEETFKVFDKAFAKDKFQFVNPLALNTYFRLFNENYKSTTDGSIDQMLNKFSQILAVIDKNKSISPENEIEFENVKISATSVVKNYLTPENLTDYAERNLKANESNVEWLIGTLDLMLDKCSEKGIFGSIALRLHAIQPSSKSAYALGVFNLKNNNREKAVVYLKEAADLATNKLQKANIYATNASILFGFDKKLAKENAVLATQNDPSNGEYYIFLSNLYASAVQECGTTPIEKKTVNYLATKMALKAAEVQPKLKATADALVAEYKKNDFTPKELEQIKKMDNKVILECWMNETVQF